MSKFSPEQRARILRESRETLERLAEERATLERTADVLNHERNLPPPEDPVAKWKREADEQEERFARERAFDRHMTDHVRAKLLEAATDWQARIDAAVAAERAFLMQEILPELVAALLERTDEKINTAVGELRAETTVQRSVDHENNVTTLPNFLRKKA